MSLHILKKGIPVAKQRRVVVTGMGVVSPLGNSKTKFWDALIEGKQAIRKYNFENYTPALPAKSAFDAKVLPCKVAALIDPDFPIEKITKVPNRISKFIQYAMFSAHEALHDAKWIPSSEKEKRETGLCIGSGIGGIEEICHADELLNQGDFRKISPFSVPKGLINLAAGNISVEYQLKGPNHAVSTACATGGHSIGDGFRMIKYGDANVMVCGGAEAPVVPYSVAGFCRTHALSTGYNDTPEQASRPFDKNRDGFVVGEGAGILVLEDLEHALARNAPQIYCEIRGYGLGGDAFHLTSPNPDCYGSMNVMTKAIEESGFDMEDIDYINAHATSTPTGDKIEFNSMKKLFFPGENPLDLARRRANPLKVSSIKGAIGHLLGAAGAVEAVATVLSVQKDIVPPNLNFTGFDDDASSEDKELIKEILATKTLRNHLVRVALSNSFGFGGTNVSLLFCKFSPEYIKK